MHLHVYPATGVVCTGSTDRYRSERKKRRGAHGNKTRNVAFSCGPRRWRTRRRRMASYRREQINSKIVIQICRNDFHPESIPKVPWESPLISNGLPPQPPGVHVRRTTCIQRHPRPSKCVHRLGERRSLFLALSPFLSLWLAISFSPYLPGINLSRTYYFFNLRLNTHISVLAIQALYARSRDVRPPR